MSYPAPTPAVTEAIDMQSLAFAIARNQCGPKLPIEEVLQTEGVAEEAFKRIVEDKLFQQQVKQFAKEMTENGVSFQLKARIQAEELLKKQWLLVHHPDTPAAVAVKAIENTVRWAGLEPKTAQTGAQGAGAGFQLVINIPQGAAPATNASTPVTIDVTPNE